jgi:hypothetical protein
MDLQIQLSSFGLCPLCSRFINTKTSCFIVSEKFKHIANRYSIKHFCKAKYTLRNSLMRIRPISVPQKTAGSVCSIPCQCGRSYIGETGRLWALKLGSKSLGKIQTSTAFICRESMCTFGKRKDFRV